MVWSVVATHPSLQCSLIPCDHLRFVSMTSVGDMANPSMLEARTVYWGTFSATFCSMTISHRKGHFPRAHAILNVHDHSDRSGAKDGAKNIKNTTRYCPLNDALQHKWTALTRKQTKELNPAIVFTILGPFYFFAAPEISMIQSRRTLTALWDFQARHQGVLPDDANQSSDLESIAIALLAKAEVNKQALATIPRDLIE